jgi:hypothetical protein
MVKVNPQETRSVAASEDPSRSLLGRNVFRRVR